MSTQDDGGPAFPCQPLDAQGNPCNAAQDGLSMRDYLAAHATDDDVAYWLRALGAQTTREAAKYAHADAMLAERKEGK